MKLTTEDILRAARAGDVAIGEPPRPFLLDTSFAYLSAIADELDKIRAESLPDDLVERCADAIDKLGRDRPWKQHTFDELARAVLAEAGVTGDPRTVETLPAPASYTTVKIDPEEMYEVKTGPAASPSRKHIPTNRFTTFTVDGPSEISVAVYPNGADVTVKESPMPDEVFAEEAKRMGYVRVVPGETFVFAGTGGRACDPHAIREPEARESTLKDRALADLDRPYKPQDRRAAFGWDPEGDE